MKPKQRLRSIAISTALGPDALVLNRFTLHERISSPFEIDAELSSVDANVDHERVVGRAATIRFEQGEGEPRYFNGYISRLVQTGNQGGFARYRATIVPWLWFLTRTSDCRVFQRKKVLEIAEEVFASHLFGSDTFEPRTQPGYRARRYCVQYRETDFNFVSRLLESEGISYWFEHQNGHHRLVLADGPDASRSAPGCEILHYHPVEQGPTPGGAVVTQWAVEKQVQPVEYNLRDFDFKKPSDPLLGKSEVRKEHGMAGFAVYDYPGDYFEASDAERYARTRLEELQAAYERVEGVTEALGLSAGGVFTMDRHPRRDQNRKYLITEVTLTADAGEFASGGTGEEFFHCAFTAIPHSTPFRPPRLTPKPVIQGVQTATVVGEKGKEVDPDRYGRVKVQFHWDRYGRRDENSSCWVRVAQPMAGKGFGGMNIPRIGHEVVVEFLEGDPDRPLINGSIYNSEQMPCGSKGGAPELQRIQEKRQQAASQTKQVIAPPPRASGGGGGAPASGAIQILVSLISGLAGAALASRLAKLGKSFATAAANPAQGVIDASMMTSLKSNSIGGSGGSNEITLNDATGSETLFVKAERDMIVSVNNDYTTTVAKDMVLDVSGDRHTMIQGKDTLNVSKESETTVGGRYSLTISKSAVVKVKAVEQHSVGGNHELTVGRDAVTTVKRDANTKITGNQSTEVAKDATFRVGGNQTDEVIKNRTTTIKGDDKLVVERTETIEVTDKIKVTGGKTIEIEGTDEILLKCGTSSISLKKGGDVEIKGTNIKLNATAKLEGKGANVSSEASAINSVKGSMVKINS